MIYTENTVGACSGKPHTCSIIDFLIIKNEAPLSTNEYILNECMYNEWMDKYKVMNILNTQMKIN